LVEISSFPGGRIVSPQGGELRHCVIHAADNDIISTLLDRFGTLIVKEGIVIHNRNQKHRSLLSFSLIRSLATGVLRRGRATGVGPSQPIDF